ncbi:MAG: FecR domain-containing protein [Gammaproteobacteria bacterium]|nr:FecR domain-containing protein [Gammaproteobacteria bacterium]
MNRKALLISILAIAIGGFSQGAFAGTFHEIATSSRVITRIIPGMTVDDIIRKIYPQEEKLWPEIKEKLIDINPDSFYQYSDKLVPGSRLKLVVIKRFHDDEEEVSSNKHKVGYIVRQEGQARVRDHNGEIQGLETNSLVYEGDRITTAKGASLYIQMDDGAEIFLKSDSVIRISEYVVTPDNGVSSSILDLIRGGLRKITGAIGASLRSNYKVQTGLATIGIRGTEYVIKLCKQDDCSQAVGRNDPGAKLHAVVLEGLITMTKEDTQILMAVGEYGTATAEGLVIEENVPVPVGMLNEDESTRFNVITIPEQIEEKQAEQAEQEPAGNDWVWLLGLGLLLLL